MRIPAQSLLTKYPLLTEENFLLILMTEFQAMLFKKFSTLTCVDSTHKTNEYGYKLISMVVADEFHNGKNHCNFPPQHVKLAAPQSMA